MQKGYGFGGIFRGLSKFIAPLASGISKVVHNPTVQSIAKDAIKTGVSLAADAIEGREMNAREESEKLLKRARTQVAEKLRGKNATKYKRMKEDYSGGDQDSESDSDSDYEYTSTNTPRFNRKGKMNGRLVKKKRKTIFDE